MGSPHTDRVPVEDVLRLIESGRASRLDVAIAITMGERRGRWAGDRPGPRLAFWYNEGYRVFEVFAPDLLNGQAITNAWSAVVERMTSATVTAWNNEQGWRGAASQRKDALDQVAGLQAELVALQAQIGELRAQLGCPMGGNAPALGGQNAYGIDLATVPMAPHAIDARIYMGGQLIGAIERPGTPTPEPG